MPICFSKILLSAFPQLFRELSASNLQREEGLGKMVIEARKDLTDGVGVITSAVAGRRSSLFPVTAPNNVKFAQPFHMTFSKLSPEGPPISIL